MSNWAFVNDEDEEAILAKVKEESLRLFKEVELPRLQNEPSTSANKVCKTSSQNYVQECSQPIWFNGPEAEGFYIAAGSSYIYPTNYPVRNYQESIVKTSLFYNTLVCLPTGLGKTFIAAVVMYNFYRWYPNGKIIFMAPTRPLVSQQIKACYNIVNMPLDDTIEMTGNLRIDKRQSLWKDKRVFFLTPQVFVNDLRSKTCPAKTIKCVVVDEAHKAVKDYAYCQVIQLLDENNSIFRILALSATPGNDIASVQQVVQNLKISKLEFRSEESIDVAPYTHSRSVENVVVDLSLNIQRVRSDFLMVYEKYAKRLRNYKALSANITTLSKFQVLKACEKFRSHPPRDIPPSLLGSLICDFSVCMSLAHGLELLQTYGLRAFWNFLNEGGGEKNKAAVSRLKNDPDLSKILDRLQLLLSVKPGKDGYLWGHPKMFKLVELVTQHFSNNKNEKTKAIIFCQYRVVVSEVFDLLQNVNSLIKAITFVGQASGKDKGMNQAKQIQIMKEFKEGIYNCMIATCVAEEGLDIGEVDLIILLESHRSPIRLVQRIGRTGRKRSGKCFVLLTRGREEFKFQEAMTARKSYVSSILNSERVRGSLLEYSPKMFPPGTIPERQYLHFNVQELKSPVKNAPSKQVDIRNCLVPEPTVYLNKQQFTDLRNEIGSSLPFNKLPSKIELFHSLKKRMSVDDLLKKDINILSEWNDWNTELHTSYMISNTENSVMLCQLLSRFSSSDYNFFKPSEVQMPSKKRRRKQEDTDLDIEDCSPTEEKVPKKIKKELPKKNFGMDIRHCMAAVIEKKKKKGMRNNICEIIDLDGEDQENFQHKNKNQQLINEILQQLDQVLVVSKRLRRKCPFENKIPHINLHTYLLDKHKMVTHDIDNVDVFLDGITPDLIPILNSCKLKKSNDSKNEKENTSNLNHSQDGDLKHKERCSFIEMNENILSESFVGFDCKMYNNFPSPDFELNLSIPDHLNKDNNVVMLKLEEKSKDSNLDCNEAYVSVDDLLCDDPIEEAKSAEATNHKTEVCADKQPMSMSGKTDNKNISHSSPNPIIDLSEKLSLDLFDLGDDTEMISESKKMSNQTSHCQDKKVTPGGIKFGWEDTPEGLAHYISPNIKDNLSGKFTSSTPKARANIFSVNADHLNSLNERSHIDTEKVEDQEADVWNISDLFEEELEEKENEKDSTMIGITQMVSMIEAEKRTKNGCDVSSSQRSCNEILFPPSQQKTKGACDKNITSEGVIKEVCNLDKSLLDEDDDLFLNVNIGDNLVNKNVSDEVMHISPVKAEQSNLVNKKNETESLNDTSDKCILKNNRPNLKNFKRFNNSEPKNDVESNSNVVSLGLSQKTYAVDKKDFGLKNTILTKTEAPKSEEAVSHPVFNLDDDSCWFDFDFSSKQKSEHDPCKLISPVKKISRNMNLSSDEEEVFKRKSLKTIAKKTLGSNSSIDIVSVKNLLTSSGSPAHRKRRRRKKNDCDFIEREAEESGSIIISDDEDSSGLDHLDESFIDDENHSDDIQAKYLQSVKSPAHGKFKIPDKVYQNDNIYSQVEPNDTEYMNDSFCVSSDESSLSENELSLLEIAEKKLAQEKKRKNAEKGDRSTKRLRISPEEKSPLNIKPQKKITKKFVIISDSDTDVSPEKKLKHNVSSDSSFEKSKLSSKSNRFSSKNGFSPFPNTVFEDELETVILASQKEMEEIQKSKQKEQEHIEEAIRRSLSDLPSTSKSIKPYSIHGPVRFHNLNKKISGAFNLKKVKQNSEKGFKKFTKAPTVKKHNTEIIQIDSD